MIAPHEGYFARYPREVFFIFKKIHMGHYGQMALLEDHLMRKSVEMGQTKTLNFLLNSATD